MRRRWVCRVVTFGAPPPELLRLVELLDALGLARLHRTDCAGLCFDLETPAGVQDTKRWAEDAAGLVERLGFSGAAAPEWPEEAEREAERGRSLHASKLLPGEWVAREPDGTLWIFRAGPGGWTERRRFRSPEARLCTVPSRNAIGTGWPGASWVETED